MIKMGLWAFIFGCIGIGIGLMAISGFVGSYSETNSDNYIRIADTLFTPGIGLFLIGVGTLAYSLIKGK